ncbi:MAG: ribbon-helix-helix domain-containing protein, partial [Leptolyngbyaceae cyanobacterium CSU_1_3]|nr:ribbon-helix-helix domain-containing protein [Leptolyngbyaceae cyanobacterium CSU_1_3]
DTQAIRVPKLFAQQLLEIARQLDEGISIEVIQKTKTNTSVHSAPPVSPGQLELLPSATTSQDETGITGRALARRLGVSSGTLQARKDREDLPDWSRLRDLRGLNGRTTLKLSCFIQLSFSYTCSSRVYTPMSLFTQKFDESKKLRSIRLTDTAWNALQQLAEEQGVTRTDLLERWSRNPPSSASNSENTVVSIRKRLESYIDSIVKSKMVPKHAMKIAPGAVVRRCLQELIDRAYPED